MIKIFKISILITILAVFTNCKTGNGYKIEGELKSLLAIVQNGADGNEGKELSLVLSKDADPLFVNFSYEDSKGATKSVKVGSLAMTQVLSIWLGKPADGGLENLKSSLLNPVY